MATNEIHVAASPAAVYAILLDPYCYPKWVVGTKTVRGVDPDWPEPGSSFHHKVRGVGRDRTELLEMELDRRLVLKVFVRPVLIGVVNIELEGLGARTRIRIHEEPAPGTSLRSVRWLLDPFIYLRNALGIRKLRRLAEARAGEDATRA